MLLLPSLLPYLWSLPSPLTTAGLLLLYPGCRWPALPCKGKIRAPVSVLDQKGASPFRALALMPVTKGNCVVATRGGEQLEVNDPSVDRDRTNSIRPGGVGEPAYYWRSPNLQGGLWR